MKIMDFDNPPDNPFAVFEAWYEDAKASEINDPNAMSLATVGANMQPNLRTVLLKGHDERGFVFYTNLQSQKGQELASNPRAALNFHWKSLQRQVRILGPIEPVSDAEADAYYHSRARESQIGAWASQQSQPIADRATLERVLQETTDKFGNIEVIPRPPHWSGRRVVPETIEFWQDGDFRIHDRVVYQSDADPSSSQRWSKQRLNP
jgi:pyridoxamine 5'-phosphate oxidase